MTIDIFLYDVEFFMEKLKTCIENIFPGIKPTQKLQYIFAIWLTCM